MNAERQAELEVRCPLCGTRYSEAEGRACHVDCPLHESCGRLSCPYCAHEVPAPTRLTRWLSRWINRNATSDPPPGSRAKDEKPHTR